MARASGSAVRAARGASRRATVDMRSDTVTMPTKGMRAAMAAARVGDDGYADDPTVNELQDRVATMFGHEAALFVPSGTMANQVALQLVVPRGSELLCDADAHVVTFEAGAAAAIGGMSTRTWPACGDEIDVDLVASMIRRPGYGTPTRAIVVEQTQNLGGGAVIPLATLRALRRVADRAAVALHCDGARIWHAHVADRVDLVTYGRLFDVMSVCLSKGLGAPVGSMVIGSADLIAEARVIRRRMGGGMRQAGVLAAAGLYALDHHVDRLADDHAYATRLAEAFAPFGVVRPTRVRTNIVMLDLTRCGIDAESFAEAAAERGIRVSAMPPHTVRLVTHLDIDETAIEHVIEALTPLLDR